jgi:hypothetical protein
MRFRPVNPTHHSHVPAAALQRAAAAAPLFLALALTACNAPPSEDGGAPPAPAVASPTAAAPPDAAAADPEGWPSRQVLEENSLALSTYGPDDPSACGLPAVDAADGRTTVLVFHGCAPRAGPALDAVPARRVSVPDGSEPMEAAVRAQLSGATDAERVRGYVSNFSPATAATPFTVRSMDGGLVVLDLDPSVRDHPMMFVSNAEARQLVAALGQFPGVERVAILIGGEPLCRALEQC